MYVHVDHKLVFLAHPRTASRWMANQLRILGFQMVGSHHGYDLDYAWYEDCHIFYTVRNHFDAMLSHWYVEAPKRGWHGSRVNAHNTLAWSNLVTLDLLAYGSVHIREAMSSGRLWYLHYDERFVCRRTVLRYESLHEDLRAFCTRFDLGDIESFDRFGETARKPDYRTAYTDVMRDVVVRTFKEEIEDLGYDLLTSTSEAATLEP